MPIGVVVAAMPYTAEMLTNAEISEDVCSIPLHSARIAICDLRDTIGRKQRPCRSRSIGPSKIIPDKKPALSTLSDARGTPHRDQMADICLRPNALYPNRQARVLDRHRASKKWP